LKKTLPAHAQRLEEKSLVDRRAFHLENKLERLAEQRTEEGLAFFFADLLRDEGILRQHSGPKDEGADMALWVESLDSIFGNPILVEFKMGNLSSGRLKRAEEQLRYYLRVTNAKAGLLIYQDNRGKRFKPSEPKWPLVICVDSRDFVSMLSEKPLAQIILSERYRVMHASTRGE